MKIRKCLWIADQSDSRDAACESARPVWARRSVVSMTCPKSFITAQSYEYLERFGFWKASGGGSLLQEDAKVADAILLLNEQWIEEERHGETEK